MRASHRAVDDPHVPHPTIRMLVLSGSIGFAIMIIGCIRYLESSALVYHACLIIVGTEEGNDAGMPKL